MDARVRHGAPRALLPAHARFKICRSRRLAVQFPAQPSRDDLFRNVGDSAEHHWGTRSRSAEGVRSSPVVTPSPGGRAALKEAALPPEREPGTTIAVDDEKRGFDSGVILR